MNLWFPLYKLCQEEFIKKVSFQRFCLWNFLLACAKGKFCTASFWVYLWSKKNFSLLAQSYDLISGRLSNPKMCNKGTNSFELYLKIEILLRDFRESKILLGLEQGKKQRMVFPRHVQRYCMSLPSFCFWPRINNRMRFSQIENI